jgi:hypothetical protein
MPLLSGNSLVRWTREPWGLFLHVDNSGFGTNFPSLAPDRPKARLKGINSQL